MSITKKCKESGREFLIDDADLAFYERMQVPPPTLCPDERTRRRWAWRGKDFYLRPCAGCKKNTISWFSPKLAGISTYCEDCFKADSFDARAYGQEFDFGRPFFEQFAELNRRVPKHSSNTMLNENCRYIISSQQSKNCYMADETDYSRDCLFGYTFQRATDVVEGLYIHDSEIGYELIKAENCYSVFYSQNVFNCSNSAFLRNCRNCRNCLFCANLRNAEYMAFNRKVSPEEFKRLWGEVFSGSRARLEEQRLKYLAFLHSQPEPAAVMINCESCEGNYITNSRNVRDSYCVDNCQDCRYSTDLHFSKDVYDVNIYEGELMYECNHAGPKGYRNLFCQIVWFASEVYYCVDCYHIKNCFGCSGLKKEEYCILNKRYSKEEYEALLPRIIAHMRETCEWGEFFPVSMSPQPYNCTMAQRFFPLEKERALQRGYAWLDEEESILEEAEHEIPDSCYDTDEDASKKVYICSQTGRKFRYIPQELEFYKKHGIPLPLTAPNVRIDDLWIKMGRRALYQRRCSKCAKEICAISPEDAEWQVLCDGCYQGVVV
ncbi:MAG: hypothetical protein DCC75_00230 [Proteobacteria bacterium]|nr:MAG: hypothetical protein DCC75_00230 [Pseudomonadota bacterium]